MKNKKYHVLVAGWVGSENTGDEAIFSSVLYTLNSVDAEVRAFSIHEKRTQKLHKIRTVPFEIYEDPIKFLSAFKWADVVVVGGGGILQDQTSIFNTPRYLYKALLGLLCGKKVMFFAVGAGPIRYLLTKFFVRHILNRCNVITVRDQGSKIVLEKVGVDSQKIVVSFDPVISLPPIPLKKSKQLIRNEIGNVKKPILGVCLRHWFDTNPFIPVSVMNKFGIKQKGGEEKYNSFVKTIASFLNLVNRNGKYAILFIPYWYSRDAKVHGDVANLLDQTEDVYHLAKAYTPSELLGIFENLDYVIAMRLHACIYAAAVHTPFLALSYTSKVNNFLSEIDYLDYGLDVDTLKSSELSKKFHLLEKTKMHVKRHLQESAKRAIEKEKINQREVLHVLQSQ